MLCPLTFCNFDQVPVSLSAVSLAYVPADATSKGSCRRSGSKHESPAAANSADTGSLSTTLEPRDWTQQAAVITDNLLDASKYKSLAVYAEVKLAEALDKASKVQPDAVDANGDPLPNSLKTAVCFQLLGELAELCGPFSSTILKLRDELLPAAYSSYAAAEATMPLRFDQMPWFRVAHHLQRDNQVLQAQQETFKKELLQHQAHFTAVEQQLLSCKAAIDAGESAAVALSATNATLVAAKNAAVEEATAAADEVKRLSADVAQLKEERNEALNQLSNLQDLSAQDKDEWEANLAALKKQILIAQQEKESAVAMAAARLTAAEGQELQQRCAEAESKLEEIEQRLVAVHTSSTAQSLLTPRPLDWGPDKDIAARCKSTAETVRQIQQQHLETVTALQCQVSMLQAMQQPDPAPKPWTLNIRTETLTYFITEGALSDDISNGYSDSIAGGLGSKHSDGNNTAKLFAEGLGMGTNVPRYLRWNELVEVQETTVIELQQQLQDIWRCKLAHEAHHGCCDLQEHLYYYFTETTVKAQAAGSCSTGGDDSSSTQHDTGLDRRAAAAAAGYSFYHACCSHRHDSAVVDAVWHVLTGQLPETVVVDQQQQQIRAVVQVLEKLAAATGGSLSASADTTSPRPKAVAGVTATDLSAALRFLYPLKAREDLAELTASLIALVSSSNHDTPIDPDGSSSSSSNAVGRDGLSQAAAALMHAANSSLVVPMTSSATQPQQVQQEPVEAAMVAAAATKLLDTLLRQHLQALLQHTQQVVQHVEQLLQGSVTTATAVSDAGQTSSESIRQVMLDDAPPLGEAANSSSSSSEATLQQVAAYLAQAVSTGSSRQLQAPVGSPHSAQLQSTAAGDGARILSKAFSSNSIRRNGGSIRSRASSAKAQDMPLLAAAAAAARVPVDGQKGISGSNIGDVGHDGSGALRNWLTAVQLLEQHAKQDHHDDAVQGLQHVPTVKEIVCWLQRECLLQPESCVPDVAAAVQWCWSALAGKARSGHGLQVLSEKL